MFIDWTICQWILWSFYLLILISLIIPLTKLVSDKLLNTHNINTFQSAMIGAILGSISSIAINYMEKIDTGTNWDRAIFLFSFSVFASFLLALMRHKK